MKSMTTWVVKFESRPPMSIAAWDAADLVTQIRNRLRGAHQLGEYDEVSIPIDPETFQPAAHGWLQHEDRTPFMRFRLVTIDHRMVA